MIKSKGVCLIEEDCRNGTFCERDLKKYAECLREVFLEWKKASV